jgi:hypothetical protein
VSIKKDLEPGPLSIRVDPALYCCMADDDENGDFCSGGRNRRQ